MQKKDSMANQRITKRPKIFTGERRRFLFFFFFFFLLFCFVKTRFAMY